LKLNILVLNFKLKWIFARTWNTQCGTMRFRVLLKGNPYVTFDKPVANRMIHCTSNLSCFGFLHPQDPSLGLTVGILALFLRRDEQRLLIMYRLTFKKFFARLDGRVKRSYSAIPPSHTTYRAIPSHRCKVNN
jgi:hypothetical protein